ncbi:hypothetical protein ACOXVJ_20315 [Pseudomonas knackmussii]|uniref:hypothetical protein n=1 Tax=Pseudomonas knackmussii TaxID=65741 RepID=UPI003BD72B5D
MQCPECGHTPTPEEQADPTRCPACGIYYHKALAAQVRKLEAENQEKERLLSQGQAKPAAPQKAQPQVVRNASALYPGAKPVVVLDINMSFGSMVVFMIKWVLASIPAFIILFIIFSVAAALFGGLLAGLMSGMSR